MTALQLANVLQALTVICLLILIVFWTIRTVRLDVLRQQLFAIRDELFDYAKDGGISFSDPAYTLLRAEMNAFIRYAHQLTTFRLVMSMGMRATAEGEKYVWSTAWEEALQNIHNAEVRDQMERYHSQCLDQVTTHLVFGSPIIMSCIAVAMMFLLIGTIGHASFTGLSQLGQAARRKIFRGILDPRSLEDEAFYAQA